MPKIGNGVPMFLLDTNANVCLTTYIAISARSIRWRYFFDREIGRVPKKTAGEQQVAIKLDQSEAAVKKRRNLAGKRKTSPEKDMKHAAYAALVEGGMSKAKAAQVLGFSPKTTGMLDRTVARKGLTISIITDKRLRASHKVVDRLLKGQKFGDISEVKDSTALRAAEIVLDRAEPKRPEGPSGNTTLSFTSINLTRYQQDPPIPIDDPLSGASIIGQAADAGPAQALGQGIAAALVPNRRGVKGLLPFDAGDGDGDGRALDQGADTARAPGVGGLKAHRDSREGGERAGDQFQEGGE